MLCTRVNNGSRKPKKSRPTTTKIPYGSNWSINNPFLSETIDLITLPPSNGGIGKRLNNISRRLINTPYQHIIENSSVNLSEIRLCIDKVKNNINKIDHIIAIIRFAIGPANATKNIALFRFWKL